MENKNKNTIKNENNVKNGNTAANNITELVMILDRSGSMSHLTDDTIGGFNGVIKEHRTGEGEVLVTTILFDDESETIHDRINIRDLELLTDKEYKCRGCTALCDALGKTIKHIESVHRYIRPEDVPSNVLFVITTDGMENSSRCYSSSAVKELIEAKQKEADWEFLFLGANIDAVETAAELGIDSGHSTNYVADSKGEDLKYRAVADAVLRRRCGRDIEGWQDEVSKDYESRLGK